MSKFAVATTVKMQTLKRPLINLPFVGDTATWAVISRAKGATLEACGPYQRRTARTRTTILTPAGPLDVSVPVHTGHALAYRDTRINYDTEWGRRVVYALQTAYNSTPFFEYFEQDYRAVFDKRHVFLWDLNIEILHLTAALAGVGIDINETEAFRPPADGQEDLRIAIEPKFTHRMRRLCHPSPYTQVFAEPYTDRPFTPWMSMLDLLFNMGPECRHVLRDMTDYTC